MGLRVAGSLCHTMMFIGNTFQISIDVAAFHTKTPSHFLFSIANRCPKSHSFLYSPIYIHYCLSSTNPTPPSYLFVSPAHFPGSRTYDTVRASCLIRPHVTLLPHCLPRSGSWQTRAGPRRLLLLPAQAGHLTITLRPTLTLVLPSCALTYRRHNCARLSARTLARLP